MPDLKIRELPNELVGVSSLTQNQLENIFVGVDNDNTARSEKVSLWEIILGAAAKLDLSDTVATLAARPSGKVDGYTVAVVSNGLTYRVISGAYQPINKFIDVDTLIQRDALFEVVTNQRVFVNDENLAYKWTGAVWVPLGTLPEDATFTQSTPALTWDFTHGFGVKVETASVFIGAPGSEQPVNTGWENIDSNNVRITFSTLQQGYVILEKPDT